MKKIFLALFSIVIFSLGCNKNEISNQLNLDNSLSKYESKVEALDKEINYVKGKKTRTLKQVVGVLVADAGGGWSGFKLGGKIGTFFGDLPAGAAAGLVLGAVLGSAYHWWQSSGIITNPTNPTNGFILPLQPDCLGSTNTYGNTEQQMGYLHNVNCRNTFQTGRIISVNNIDFFEQFYASYCSNISASNIASSNIISDPRLKTDLKNSLVDLSQVNSYSTFVTYCNKYSNDNVTNSIFLSLMERVFQVDESNYDIIFSYADSYLDNVATDNTLDMMQKNQLKYSINILKYSASLWKNNN